MIKSIYLAKRNPNTTYEEFMENWRQHAVLSGSFPDVGKYFDGVVQCKRIQDLEIPGLSTEYDGANILTLTSLLGAVEVHDQEGIETLRKDEKRVFADYVIDTSMTVHETVVQDKPIGQFVLVEFARRNEGVTPQEFVKSWSGAYGRALVASEPFEKYVGRYVHNHVVLPSPPGYEFDGISETWFENLDDAKAFIEQSQGVRAEPTLFDVPIRTLLEINHAWFRRKK